MCHYILNIRECIYQSNVEKLQIVHLLRTEKKLSLLASARQGQKTRERKIRNKGDPFCTNFFSILYLCLKEEKAGGLCEAKDALLLYLFWCAMWWPYKVIMR